MNRVILAAAKDKTFSVCMCVVLCMCEDGTKLSEERQHQSRKMFIFLFPIRSCSLCRFIVFFYSLSIYSIPPSLYSYSTPTVYFDQRKIGFVSKVKEVEGLRLRGNKRVRLKRREGSQKPPPQGRAEETINFITPTSASSISLCALCCLFGSSECCRCHTLFFSRAFSFWFCFSLYFVGLELALWLHCLSNPIPLAFSALINSTLNLPSLSLFSSFPFSYPLVLFKNSIPTETFFFQRFP